jgi:hypothetical protein
MRSDPGYLSEVDVDASLALTLDDDPARADVGPQHTFVLPNGVLELRGGNTLALAVLTDGSTPAGPGTVALILLHAAAEGAAPSHGTQEKGHPATAPRAGAGGA